MFGPHVSAINLFQIPVRLFKVKLLNLLSIRLQKHFDLERLLRIPRTKYLQYLNELAIYSVEYTGISKISSHYISIVLIFTFCFWMSPYCLINTLLHLMGTYHKTWANNTIKKNTVTEPSKKYNPRVLLHPNASGKIKKKINHDISLENEFHTYTLILFYAHTVGINKFYWQKAQFLAVK